MESVVTHSVPDKPTRGATVILRNVSRDPPVPFVCHDVVMTSITQVRTTLDRKTGERGAALTECRVPTSVRVPVGGETGHLDPGILATPGVLSGFRAKVLRGRLILGPGEHVGQYGHLVGDLVSRGLIEVVGRSRRSEKKTKLQGERDRARAASRARVSARRVQNMRGREPTTKGDV